MGRSRRSFGFSLIEVVVTLTIVLLIATVSLTALRSGRTKAPVHSLGIVLTQEFEAARQLAIAEGHPVALCLPTDAGKNPRATSIYRLEGWNKPLVTYSRNYGSEYPEVFITAARWSGGNFTDGLPAGALSKFGVFQLNSWLPEDFRNDSIFCFTPDGSLVTNGQPALNGAYTVVVAERPDLGGSGPDKWTVKGAQSAVTVLVSPSGGTDLVTGLPGGPQGGGSSGNLNASKAQTRTNFGAGGATVKISHIRVLPNPDDAPPNQGVCVPGQVVTLEVYAYDPEGRALFAKWTQTPLDTKEKGQFSYPFSESNSKLVGEVDKMEFTYDLPPELKVGTGWVAGQAPPPGVGVFRARWNWTVPITSQPGHRYRVQADVRDVKGEVYIENPPTKTLNTPPVGRLIVERQNGAGRWELVMMNPDGSGERVLTPSGTEECMPSLDRAASKLAFLQGPLGNRRVKIRSLEGGPDTTIAGPGNFTSVSLSPDGAWISYRNNSTDQLITQRLDGGRTLVNQQTILGGGHTIKKTRSGWSQNGRFVLFEHNGFIWSRDLKGSTAPNVGTQLITQQFWNDTRPENTYNGPETPHAPTSYMGANGERLMVSLGVNNPVLVSVSVTNTIYEEGGINPGDLRRDYSPATAGDKLRVDYGGNSSMGAGGSDNDFPSISPDGQTLCFTRSVQSSGVVSESPDANGEDTQGQQLWQARLVGDNFINAERMPMEGNVRRAIWVPTEKL